MRSKKSTEKRIEKHAFSDAQMPERITTMLGRKRVLWKFAKWKTAISRAKFSFKKEVKQQQQIIKAQNFKYKLIERKLFL